VECPGATDRAGEITSYELRVTNYNEDRFRRGGSDPIGHVIDMASSWNAANGNGDGWLTT
jgi:hypothetical protein